MIMDYCDGYGMCQEVCPVDCITYGNPSVIDEDECIECGRCVDECPTQAIIE